MGKKRLSDLGSEQEMSADASAFRAAVRDVKPLVQLPAAPHCRFIVPVCASK